MYYKINTRCNNETTAHDDCEIVSDEKNNSKMCDAYGYARHNNKTTAIDDCKIVSDE